MIRPILLALLLAALLAMPAHAEDLVVVVAPHSRIERLTHNEVVNIFLGRYRKLPDGQNAMPVDTEPLKASFYLMLVGKTLADINAYWARLVFSGTTRPPLQASSEQMALELLEDQREPTRITYVERHKVGQQRIVFDFK